MRSVWDFAWNWFFDHGLPGNLAASAITGFLGFFAGRKWIWRKHVKPHLDHITEIHTHLGVGND